MRDLATALSRRLGAVGLAWVLTALVVPPVTGQVPNEPGQFVIRDARIVTGTGQTIERGSVVIEDGLITAVGPNVQVPPGAWVIDGTGLSVYPGMIDAFSAVGMPSPPSRDGAGRGPGGGGGGGDQPYSRGPQDRPGTETWVNAADVFDASEETVSNWRNAGFTTVIVAPPQGIFPGQTAVMNLAGDRPNDMVVRTPVGLRINLDRGQGYRGFPGSLMGSIAYVKQVFLDARHYDQAWTIYESDPQGRERPQYDRTLAPVRDAVNQEWPVMLPGTRAREIRRAIDLGETLGISTVIYGAHEGYAAADDLARAGTPVLVSADWPGPPENGDPEADFALETLRLWDRAPTTPAALQAAGVPFALYADELDADEVRQNVGLALQAGLSEDAAVRALSLTPAEIFGVADRLGSIETGKIANLTVTSGPLFDDATQVRMVFVDGRRFETADQADQAVASRPGGNNESRDQRRTWSEPVPMVQDRGPMRTAETMIIRHATIMTASNGVLEDGDILIREGRIAQIGSDLDAPRGALEIDATGRYVTPGIIDAHSHLAVDGGVNEGTISVSAMVGIQDVLDPDDIGIYRAVAGGVTSANILHGSANPIGGKNAVVKFRWGADADEMLFDGAPPGIKFALGENPKRDRNPDRYPNTRMGVMDVIRQAFLDAQTYQRKWEAYESRRASDPNAIPPRRDLEMEALVEILEGERLVHAHSYRADEILQLMRLAEEFGFRIATFQHVLEGYKVADELAEHGAGASTFSDWWGYKVEAYQAIPYNAALMTERGVTVSINSDSGEEIRHLNQEAAKTMRWGGLSEEEALRLVTLNPARQLGIADRVGSIEVGKDADLAIFNGHPLSSYGVVEQTIIDGQVYFDRQLDRERQQRLQQEKQALLEKYRPAAGSRQERVTTDIAGPQGGSR